MSTADRLARVADRLRAQGHRVVEVNGWRTRGRGTLTPRGHLEHHTAGSASGDAPSLRVVTFGRAGLRNALCTWYVSRSGVIYLVAAGVAWHAGSGIHGSNATLSGTEAENTGVGEPWTPGSLAAQAAVSAEMAREFSFAHTRVFDHREHAPSRKIDRTGINPASWRERIRQLLTTDPAAAEEDDEMSKIVNVAGDLYHVAGIHAVHILNRDDDTVGALKKAGAREEVWPGNADSFVDAHVIHAGGGAPRPRESTVTS